MASEPYVWDGSDKFYHSPRPGVDGSGAGTLTGDGPPVDGVTGLNETKKLYQNNTPDFNAGEAVLYVNIDEASPSTNPQWRGVVNT